MYMFNFFMGMKELFHSYGSHCEDSECLLPKWIQEWIKEVFKAFVRSLLSLLVSQKHKTQEQTAQTFVLQSPADYCETRVLLLLCFLRCMKHAGRRRAEPLDCCIVAEWFCGLLRQNTKQKELSSLQRQPVEVRLCPWKGRIQSATVLRCRVPSLRAKEHRFEGSQASPSCPSDSGIRWR